MSTEALRLAALRDDLLTRRIKERDAEERGIAESLESAKRTAEAIERVLGRADVELTPTVRVAIRTMIRVVASSSFERGLKAGRL